MPRYSIVIPTRNGAETLRATLRTVLAVDYDDYEVVVCDNDTSDATRRLIEEIAAPRIRYIKAPRPLAMSSNWELAVSEARGEYVTVLGDDDGLLPQALRFLDQLLSLTQASAIRWDAAFFVWPTVEIPGQANYLRLKSDAVVHMLDGAAVVQQVMDFDRCYSSLPMLYNSIVERHVLDGIRAQAGRVFLDRVPDIASGFAVAHVTGRYASVAYPMTVAGVSHKSTGLGTLFSRTRFGDDWQVLNAAEQWGGDDRLPDLFVFPTIPVAEAYLAVRDRLIPPAARRPLDRRRLLEHCLASLRAHSREEWDEAVRRLGRSCEDDADLATHLQEQLQRSEPRCDGPLPLRLALPGVSAGSLHVNTDQFGVHDVADAVRLCTQLLASSEVTPRWTLSTDDPMAAEAGQSAELRRLHRQLADIAEQLQSKEALLQRNCSEMKEKEAALQQACRQLESKEASLQDADREIRTLAAARNDVHQQLTQAIATVERQAEAAANLRSTLTRKHHDLLSSQETARNIHAQLLEKHAALVAVQDVVTQLQQQLDERQRAVDAALQRCSELQARTLWQRIRNVA